jgi:hypothetical protein
MPLKLFRSTGYSTLLMPGESRLATHPLKLVLWASAWLGVACNVGIWRLLAGEGDPRLTLAWLALVGGGSGVVLSLLGWRRTLKPTITVMLIAAALVAAGLWSQQLPVNAVWQGPPRTVLPGWASFMRWQVLVLVLVLAVVPIVSLWNMAVRRLPGPAQLKANLSGAAAATLVFATGLFILR